MHPTSLNVSVKIFNQISNTSKKTGISKRKIISKIFLYCHNNINFNFQEIGKLTGYQKKSDDDSWKCMRIDFTDTQCDVYLFYRNHFRISLSKLFAVGFFLFFDEVIKELSEEIKMDCEVLKSCLHSYTEIKSILYNSIKNVLKYFENNDKNKT